VFPQQSLQPKLSRRRPGRYVVSRRHGRPDCMAGRWRQSGACAKAQCAVVPRANWFTCYMSAVIRSTNVIKELNGSDTQCCLGRITTQAP